MRITEFDFNLPPERIATFPVEPRDHSRLLVVERDTGRMSDKHFYDLTSELEAGDLLVLNRTKVLPARLFGFAADNRKFEVMLLKRSSTLSTWECLVRPGNKVTEQGLELNVGGDPVFVTRNGDTFFAALPHFDIEKQVAWLEQHGKMPLPPYIKREATQDDSLRYQTVFAQDWGSVAAPTAGLHFTPELLEKVKAKGVEIAEVTLHVGYGTFAPVRVEDLSQHEMHSEAYTISEDTYARLEKAKQERRRIIAVGTTTLRALESIPTLGLTGETRIFIQPGYKFQWADGLITNFHLPQSTLLVLVSAFLGKDLTHRCYQAAIEREYRFYTYGDAMLIV